jgi:hypothetical protein
VIVINPGFSPEQRDDDEQAVFWKAYETLIAKVPSFFMKHYFVSWLTSAVPLTFDDCHRFLK